MCCVSLYTHSRWSGSKEQERWFQPSLAVSENKSGVGIQWEDALGFNWLMSPIKLQFEAFKENDDCIEEKLLPPICQSLNMGLVFTQFDHSNGMTVIAFFMEHYTSKQSNILPSVTLMQSPLIYFFYHFSQCPNSSPTCQLRIYLTALGIFHICSKPRISFLWSCAPDLYCLEYCSIYSQLHSPLNVYLPALPYFKPLYL